MLIEQSKPAFALRSDMLKAVKHVSLASVGVSASQLNLFLKALSSMRYIESLDISGNHLPFYCIDALVTFFKSQESQPKSKKRHQLSNMSIVANQKETYLSTLRLSKTRLDELSAF